VTTGIAIGILLGIVLTVMFGDRILSAFVRFCLRKWREPFDK
jgi:hypothetical protein